MADLEPTGGLGDFKGGFDGRGCRWERERSRGRGRGREKKKQWIRRLQSPSLVV